MSRLIVLPVLFLLLQCPLPSLSNSEGDALINFKTRISDPDSALSSWDPTLVNPCTWFHITCDESSSTVIRIDLGGYNLGGTIGPELALLPNLQYLELYNNRFTGSIPEELGNLNNIVAIDLYNNQLEGNIPTSFGKLKSLNFLRVNDNTNMAGVIPIEVIRLNLQVFNYSNTRLTKP